MQKIVLIVGLSINMMAYTSESVPLIQIDANLAHAVAVEERTSLIDPRMMREYLNEYKRHNQRIEHLKVSKIQSQPCYRLISCYYCVCNPIVGCFGKKCDICNCYNN